MAEIEAVYFDIGGVLLTNGWDHVERARVLDQFGVDRAAYEARHPEANDAWEKGEITVETFLRETVFFEPRPFTPEAFLAAMREQSQWLPYGAINVLRALRAAGRVKLAMLNNESRELNDYRIEHFGLDCFFHGFFSSCYLGLRKPDPAIFEAGLALMHQKPERSAFVDDREGNCAAAAKLGFHAIQYRNEEQFAQELRALGVAVELGQAA